MSITYMPASPDDAFPVNVVSPAYWSMCAASYDAEAMRDRDHVEEWRAEARYCREMAGALVLEAQRLERADLP